MSEASLIAERINRATAATALGPLFVEAGTIPSSAQCSARVCMLAEETERFPEQECLGAIATKGSSDTVSLAKVCACVCECVQT